MMTITVNGEPRDMEAGATIKALLKDLDITGSGIAVELNREIVPASSHESVVLREGDRVEIVRMTGGG